jgi:2-oxoglutarate ferredoxin oxidoreductase subunit gamma
MDLNTRDPLRIRLTGRGGQGVMLAGAILAEAAMRAGRHVVQTQDYGPEARLGATKADVVVSAREIALPSVVLPDVLLCLSRPGYLRYGRQVARDGLVLVEASLDLAPEGQAKGAQTVPLALRESARALGGELFMNVMGIAALCALTGVVAEEQLAEAVAARVKPGLREPNIRALAEGFALGRAAGRRSQAERLTWTS